MDAKDIGFFKELQGVLANKRVPKLKPKGLKLEAKPKQKKEKGLGVKREPKPKSYLDLLTLTGVPNPCSGCPFEPKPKLIDGVGDVDIAKLLIIMDKVTPEDLYARSMAFGWRYKKFLPLFKQAGFTEDDLYWVALTRCSGQENLDAVTHCANYLRKELSKPNIKASLILGLRPFQLLIDQKRTTVFKARGQIFQLLGKPCLVTWQDFDE